MSMNRQHAPARRLHRADGAERARVRRVLTDALEAEPDVVSAYLHGSFLTGGCVRRMTLNPAPGRGPFA